jgi:hypothetical protein
VRDVALVPERDVLQRRGDHAANQTGEAGQVLAQHRVALVRHRRGALLAGEKILLGFQTSVRCRWRISVARRSIEEAMTPSVAEEHGVPIARDDLGGDRLGLQPELFGDIFLDLRVDIGEGADGAGDGAGRDLGARRDEPGAVAGKLGIGLGQLDAEGGRLGMDAVAAADGRS